MGRRFESCRKRIFLFYIRLKNFSLFLKCKSNVINSLNNKNKFTDRTGQILFYAGLFLLPSAFSISVLFLLFSCLIGFFINKEDFFKDKLNTCFLIGGLLLIFSSIYNSTNFNESNTLEVVNPFLKNIELLNWIPLILCFYCFQPYLRSKSLRRNSALIILSGTIPVILSAIGQAFFEWHGPMQTLNGLIIWYQRPINGITSITGLFNNQNYLGCWLNIIWPFCMALFLKKQHFRISKIVIFLFLTSIALVIVLSASRAAWLGLILSIPIYFGKRSAKWFIPFLGVIFIIFILIFIPIFGENFQNIMRNFIPSGIWSNFSQSTYDYEGSISRIELWKESIEIIFENPILGTGASSFSSILEAKVGIWRAHAHNLPLELIVSYGIPAAFLILIPFALLVKFSFEEIFIRNSFNFREYLFDRAWITSIIILSGSHLVDIQYFDGRISIAGWVLLAGARNIIRKK